MRKTERLPPEVLAPYQWVPTGDAGRVRWGAGPSGDAPPEPPNRIDWGALFGNAHPVEMEVGFGKGLFLATSAAANPGVNYFGVEIVRKYQLLATARLAKRHLTNAKTCCADAARVMRDHIDAGSLSALHVYFPDPWWKARHKKRTLFTPEFARLVVRVLRPDGVLHFATDVPDYADMVAEVLAGVPELEALAAPEESPPEHDMDYLTNFERRFRKQGKPIRRSRHRRQA